MLFKFNANGISITESQNGTTTTLNIDSISFEENCTAEEAVETIKAFVDIVKELPKNKRRNKRRNTRPVPTKRYHIYSLINNHFVHDVQDDKYYTICAGSGIRETTKEKYCRMIHRVKNNIQEGYFDNTLKEYYSDTLPAAE